MAESIPQLMQNISEIKRLARLMGASRVNALRARQDSIFYFVNPDGDGPGYPLDADELHYEFPAEAVLFIAIFPLKTAPKDRGEDRGNRSSLRHFKKRTG